MIILRRVDPSRNMARFYALSIERSLFGEAILVRRWGRIGTHGRRREMWFGRAERALSALEELRRAKERRGYVAIGLATG